MRAVAAIFCILFVSLTLSAAGAAQMVNGFEVISQQEAVERFGQIEAKLAARTGVLPRKIYPATHELYPKAKEIAALVWSGFSKHYPKETSGLNVPEVVIIEDATANAYAVYDGATKTIPFLFVVHTSLLKMNRGAVLGVVAHEFAHLIFKHVDPQIMNSIKKHYVVTFEQEPFGYLQENDPVAEAQVKAALAEMANVGPNIVDEIGDLPFDIWGQAQYFQLLRFAFNKFKRAEISDCEAVETNSQKVIGILIASTNMATQELKVPAKEKENLSALAKVLRENFKQCLSGIKPDLAKLFADQTGRDVAWVRKLIESQPERLDLVFDQQANLIDSFGAITRLSQEKLAKIQAEQDLKKLRIYTHEEHADEVSIEVMKALGLNPYNNSKFLLLNIPKAQRLECLSEIRTGKVPYYGNLSDPHHSTCYRLYHSQRYISKI